MALKFKQRDLRERATTDAVALAEPLLAGAEDEARVLLVVLEGLQALEYDVADLAERAADRFAHDVDAQIGFLEVLRKDAPQTRHAEIDTLAVRTLLDAAAAADAEHRRLRFSDEGRDRRAGAGSVRPASRSRDGAATDHVARDSHPP